MSDEDDPSLDFLSTSFDPVKVLQTPPTKLSLPHPTVQPCDNLQTYTSVVQGTRQNSRPLTSTTDVGGVKGASQKEGVVSNVQGPRARQVTKTVFDFMERTISGPLSLLQCCRLEGRPVRVVTRHCAGVRGVCTGIIIVFDRHMNLVLSDVREWCTPFRTRANGGIKYCIRKKKKVQDSPANIMEHVTPPLRVPPPENKALPLPGDAPPLAPPLNMKWEVFRTVNQLFIRGDNIVLISSTP